MENIRNVENNEKENKIHDDNDHPENLRNSWSQVTSKKPPVLFLDKRLWIIGAFCLIIIFIMIFSGHKKSSDHNNHQDVISKSDNTELNQNLAKLKSMTSEIQNAQNQMNAKNSAMMSSNPLLANQNSFGSTNLLSRKQSKELLARQNAPTTMYSAAMNTNTVSAQNRAQAVNANSTSGTTFAGQGVNTAFGNQSMSTTSVIAKKIAHPEYTIASGEFLHAVLETAINSDLPGEIRAVVSQPVYAYVGETPLIPAGSRLIGQYSSSVMQGQNRVFVVWNRVILPNGVSAQINSPGTDQLGIAGISADDVDTHFLARFGEASLLSIIGAGAATGGVSNSDQYNSAAQYRMAISQSFQQSADNSLQGTLPTQSTLSIDQGASINVFVAHDIDFYSVMKAVS